MDGPLSEINKDGQMVGLAAVYLNEYRVASAAFTLHSQEPKCLKVWREQILKAKEIYQEAKSASRIYQVCTFICYFHRYSNDKITKTWIQIYLHYRIGLFLKYHQSDDD